jgi:hypothetical protein
MIVQTNAKRARRLSNVQPAPAALAPRWPAGGSLPLSLSHGKGRCSCLRSAAMIQQSGAGSSGPQGGGGATKLHAGPRSGPPVTPWLRQQRSWRVGRGCRRACSPAAPGPHGQAARRLRGGALGRARSRHGLGDDGGLVPARELLQLAELLGHGDDVLERYLRVGAAAVVALGVGLGVRSLARCAAQQLDGCVRQRVVPPPGSAISEAEAEPPAPGPSPRPPPARPRRTATRRWCTAPRRGGWWRRWSRCPRGGR